MQNVSPQLITFVVLVPLIGWRLWTRVRRMIGRQRLSGLRPWITALVFPLLIVVLGLQAQANPMALGLLAVGLAAGVLLGVYGHTKTRFEHTSEGLFYTPNAHLGIALSALFTGRIVYRLYEIYANAGAAPSLANPLTLGLFGLLAGYYVSYAIGLLRWRQRVLREAASL